jgi:hypothetical protein
MQMYDQRALLARLEPLDRGAKTAFASASAQRLLPLFGRYARVAGVPAHTQRLAGILAAAWDVSSGRVIDVRSMDSEVESMAHPNVDVTDAMVVGSEIAQAALLAMEEDLAAVASTPPSWRELRQRAEAEGRTWAATFP